MREVGGVALDAAKDARIVATRSLPRGPAQLDLVRLHERFVVVEVRKVEDRLANRRHARRGLMLGVRQGRQWLRVRRGLFALARAHHEESTSQLRDAEL